MTQPKQYTRDMILTVYFIGILIGILVVFILENV